MLTTAGAVTPGVLLALTLPPPVVAVDPPLVPAPDFEDEQAAAASTALIPSASTRGAVGRLESRWLRTGCSLSGSVSGTWCSGSGVGGGGRRVVSGGSIRR